MAKPARFVGVERHEEIDIRARRDDARSFQQKLRDLAETPEGTRRIFLCLVVAALAFSLIPFVPECLVLVAVGFRIFAYSYKAKRWHAPFRVPAYLGRKGYRDASEGGKPGEGQIYMGAAQSSRSAKFYEVWASPNDTRTHRMVVGTTGSGKTEELMGAVFNSVMLNSGSTFTDAKAHVKTDYSMYRICRLFGRDEEFFHLNLIKGGKDIFGAPKNKISNTLNPFGFGSSSMKAELMNDLIATSNGADIWMKRAISFNAAIMPLLSFLADRGYILFSPRVLVDYYNLDRLENLVWFGLVQRYDGKVIDLKTAAPMDWAQLSTDAVSGSMKLYLNELPSYTPAKPTRPNPIVNSSDEEIREAILMGPEAVAEWEKRRAQFLLEIERQREAEKNGGPAQSAEKARETVYQQHGFITMQLVQATGLLTFEYDYIFNAAIGEIDFKDLMLNRRLLMVSLPSLERAPDSLLTLARLSIASVKGVLAAMLDIETEGNIRIIVNGRPYAAEQAYNLIHDEYGYQVVPGYAVAPAQGRGFGVSITFGAQDLPSLRKGDANEAEATWENTNIRLIGRSTGGEESETYKKFAGAAGYASVSVAGEMNYQHDALSSSFAIASGSRVEKVSRLSVDDLNAQKDGEFTMVVGTKMGENTGSVRVVRYKAFYTGDIPELHELRKNHFVAVRPPTTDRLKAVRETQELRRAMMNVTSAQIETWLDAPAQTALRASLVDSALSHLAQRLAELPEGMPDEAIAEAGLSILSNFVRARLTSLIEGRVMQEVAPLERRLREDIEADDFAAEDRAALLGVLSELMDRIKSQRMLELTGQKSIARRVAQARKQMAA